MVVCAEQLAQPLLHHRLAIAARDTHYGNLELCAVLLGKLLECGKRVAYKEEVGLGHCLQLLLARTCRYYKMMHTTPIELRNVAVPVATTRHKRKEECLLGKA